MNVEQPFDIRDRIVRGHTAERRIPVTCASCGERYEVVLRASASANGRSSDVAAVEAEAAALAARNLDRQEPMEACPSCGLLQEEMVERLFTDPRHAAARKRHDDCRDAANAPWARALRLQRKGKEREEIAARVASGSEHAALLPVLLGFIEADEKAKRRRSLASATEGQLLVELLRRRHLSGPAMARVLEELHGVDPARARNLAHAHARDTGRSQEAFVMVTAGIFVIGLGGLITFLLTVVAPLVKDALYPPEPAPVELRMTFPQPVHYREPRGRHGGEGPVPVGAPYVGMERERLPRVPVEPPPPHER